MKKLLLSIGLLAGFTMQAYCQGNADTTAFLDLTPPTSPAFNLLDVAPTSVERPGTVRAFAVSIANAIGSSSNGFPKNFALQVAPYWMFVHPRMNIYKYNGLTLKKGENGAASQLQFKQNIFYGLRNFSLSAASINVDSSQSNPYVQNYIAYSLKANVLNIRRRQVLEVMQQTITHINSTLVAATTNAITPCASMFDPADAQQQQSYNSCINSTVFRDSAIINAQRRKYDSVLAIRPLFTMDVALASSMAFANNNFNDHHVYRSGGWITACLSEPLDKGSASPTAPAFYNAKNYLNIYGLARVISEDNTSDFKTFVNQTDIDFGGRLELEFGAASISFESVYRKVSNHPELNTSRNVGIIQYRLSSNLFLTGTFGKNFGDTNNLVSFLGLNWGFGKTSLYNKLSYQ
jgi:hypothetical protein